MKIYKLGTLEQFQYFTTDEVINDNLFDGRILSLNWESIYLEGYPKSLKKGDIRNILPGIPTFNEKVIKCLHELIHHNVELLNMTSDDKKNFKIINVTKVIDCIDFSEAIPIRAYSGVITRFKKYSFKEKLIENEHIFKIPEQKITAVFVSDEFKRQVEQNKLKGFEFIEVWNSKKE